MHLKIRMHHETPPTFYLLCTVIENLIHLAIAAICIIYFGIHPAPVSNSIAMIQK